MPTDEKVRVRANLTVNTIQPKLSDVLVFDLRKTDRECFSLHISNAQIIPQATARYIKPMEDRILQRRAGRRVLFRLSLDLGKCNKVHLPRSPNHYTEILSAIFLLITIFYI